MRANLSNLLHEVITPSFIQQDVRAYKEIHGTYKNTVLFTFNNELKKQIKNLAFVRYFFDILWSLYLYVSLSFSGQILWSLHFSLSSDPTVSLSLPRSCGFSISLSLSAQILWSFHLSLCPEAVENSDKSGTNLWPLNSWLEPNRSGSQTAGQVLTRGADS